MRESGSSQNGEHHSVTITGTEDEINDVKAMVRGACWIRATENGSIERRDSFIELPKPEDDPVLPPWWALSDEKGKEVAELLVAPAIDPNGWCSPSVFISHLCGYNWTKPNYQTECRVLMSLGFECLRSRRGRNGQFWEIWYLPFFRAARGKLGEFLKQHEGKPWHELTEIVVKWCCRNLSFGCLDVAVQRAAMAVD